MNDIDDLSLKATPEYNFTLLIGKELTAICFLWKIKSFFFLEEACICAVHKRAPALSSVPKASTGQADSVVLGK